MGRRMSQSRWSDGSGTGCISHGTGVWIDGRGDRGSDGRILLVAAFDHETQRRDLRDLEAEAASG